MQRQSPDDGAIIGESMKTKRVTFDGCRAENERLRIHSGGIFPRRRGILGGENSKLWDVNVEGGQLLPSLSSMVLAARVTRKRK